VTRVVHTPITAQRYEVVEDKATITILTRSAMLSSREAALMARNAEISLSKSSWIYEYEKSHVTTRTISQWSMTSVDAIFVYLCFNFDILLTSNGLPSYFLPHKKPYGDAALLYRSTLFLVFIFCIDDGEKESMATAGIVGVIRRCVNSFSFQIFSYDSH
jgi:hypothetical protein